MMAVVDVLSRAGELWWRYALHAAWQASVLGIVVLVVVRLGRRWPAPLRYWLLVVALVKFAVPPLLSVPTGLFSWIGPRVAPVAEQAVPEEPRLTSPNPLGESTDAAIERTAVEPPSRVAGSGSLDETTGDEEHASDTEVARRESPPVVAETSSSEEAGARAHPVVAAATPAAGAETAPRSIGWKAWLLASHALGFVVIALWTFWQIVVLRRVVARARAIGEGGLHERFVRLWRSMSKRRPPSRRRPPRLLVSTEPVAPMVFGVWRPAVVVPSSAVDGLPSDQLDTMLAHELAHVRRRDTWVNWFQIVLTAVWWFNPVVWVLNRAVRKAREDCCDDLVLHRGETSNDAYCETLLHAASKLAAVQPVGARLGFADRLHPLGARMKRIMDTTLRRAPGLTLAGILLVAFLAVVLLPGLGCRRSKEEKREEAKRPEQAEQWHALVAEQKKLIEDYKAQLERLQEDTGAAKVLAEQVVYWERKVADAEAELLALRADWGDEHPKIKQQRVIIDLYKQKLDEARKRAAEVPTTGPSIGPVEAGSRPELNGALLDAAREGNLAGVKSLIERGAFVNARDEIGRAHV